MEFTKAEVNVHSTAGPKPKNRAMNTTAKMKMTNGSWCTTGESHHMHHESAVAAMADAYQAARSAQPGSNLYIGVCRLCMTRITSGG